MAAGRWLAHCSDTTRHRAQCEQARGGGCRFQLLNHEGQFVLHYAHLRAIWFHPPGRNYVDSGLRAACVTEGPFNLLPGLPFAAVNCRQPDYGPVSR
jgi:hypothetical protein